MATAGVGRRQLRVGDEVRVDRCVGVADSALPSARRVVDRSSIDGDRADLMLAGDRRRQRWPRRVLRHAASDTLDDTRPVDDVLRDDVLDDVLDDGCDGQAAGADGRRRTARLDDLDRRPDRPRRAV